MREFKAGDEVKLKFGPAHKPSSNNNLLGHRGNKYRIKGHYRGSDSTGDKSYTLVHSISGNGAGWVYEYEIVGCEESKEEIINEIETLQSQIDCLNSKLDWMEEVDTDVYNEEEFKVYETLRTLENGELGLKEKTKLIASLINGSNC